LCLPIKANLISTDEDQDESPALADVSAATIAALQTILRAHRGTMKRKDTTAEQYELAEDKVIRVANTLSKVLESARKLQDDGLAVIRNMGFEARAQLFAIWYQGLPPAQRQRVSDGMKQFEGSSNQPLLIPADEPEGNSGGDNDK